MPEKRSMHEAVVNQLQKDTAFEKISGAKIKLIIHKFQEKYKDFHAQSIWIPRLFRYIVVNQERLDDDPDEIAAIIAHELGHHEHYYNLGTIEYLRRMFMLIFKKGSAGANRRDMEVYADKKTIEAGCAHGLYNHRIKHPRSGSRKNEDAFYMSPEEIETYAKSIGKW